MSYESYLNKLIDVVFKEASTKYTWRELAKKAGLSYTTVYRLGTYKTKFPQLRTAYLLCKTVGMELPAIHSRRKYKIAG